jgi:hypothetical protein
MKTLQSFFVLDKEAMNVNLHFNLQNVNTLLRCYAHHSSERHFLKKKKKETLILLTHSHRVTGLGEFSLIGRLQFYAVSLRMTEMAQLFGYFFEH